MDGRPAILERPVGNGRAMALAAGPARSWGDLATRPEFVVLAHSLVESFRQGQGDRNLVLGRDPAGRNRPPGNDAAQGGPVSLNLHPAETAALAPDLARLKSAFRADRVRVLDPGRVSAAKGIEGPGAGDAAGWVGLALCLALAAEAVVATGRPDRRRAGDGETRP
jgi:hypothetical protein